MVRVAAALAAESVPGIPPTDGSKLGPSQIDYDQYKADTLLGEMFWCDWEHQQRSSKGRLSPVAMGEALLGQQSTSQAMAQESISVHQCTSPGSSESISVVNPGNSVKKSERPARGTGEHEECKVVYYGCLCEVVSPEKRAQYAASCKGYDHVLGSDVAPGTRKPVWLTEVIGESKKTAI